jgi:hypothetical protein
MTDITNQKLGGTGTNTAIGDGAVRAYTTVVDIAEAVADGLTSGDNIQLMTLPAGSVFFGLQAENLTALVMGATPLIDIGTTDADPDEYIDGQTKITTGVLTDTAAALTTAAIATELTLVMELNGGTLTSGKIAVTVWLGKPTIQNIEAAKPKVYTN